MLTRIFNMVEGSNKVLKELKNYFSTLTQIVSSHSMSIKHLDTQMCQLSTQLNPRQKESFPVTPSPIPNMIVDEYEFFVQRHQIGYSWEAAQVYFIISIICVVSVGLNEVKKLKKNAIDEASTQLVMHQNYWTYIFIFAF